MNSAVTWGLAGLFLRTVTMIWPFLEEQERREKREEVDGERLVYCMSKEEN